MLLGATIQDAATAAGTTALLAMAACHLGFVVIRARFGDGQPWEPNGGGGGGGDDDDDDVDDDDDDGGDDY